jgi:uncharacterized protein YcaQ
MNRWPIPIVNAYLAHKQHLLPASSPQDVVQVTRDIVALHATSATSPYLSLWARMPDFRREMLKDALYEQRELVKVLCMRVTLHIVPGDEASLFLQAYKNYIEKRTPPRFRGGGLLAHAGLCAEEEADALLIDLHRRVLDILAERGVATTQEIAEAVPELQAKIRHDVGKPYEGEFSIGTRLIGDMCAQGLLVRTRVRGSWRSNLYEYAPLADWLPATDLASVTPPEARTWLVRRYLVAFGPASLDDVQWWTGFSKTDTRKALKALAPEIAEVAIEGLDGPHLVLAADAERMADFSVPDEPFVCLLPSLDPYIMGYRDRRRFLADEHRPKLFDRAGNSVPTVWLNGRVVGSWGHQEDGCVQLRLLEETAAEEQALLEDEAARLEEFLGDEPLRAGFLTPSFDQLAGGVDTVHQVGTSNPCNPLGR